MDFDGGLKGVLATVYNQRAHLIPGYGTGSHKATVAEADSNIWLKAVKTLDRNDPKQMVMLIMLINGCFFALRGNTEHADLSISNIEQGSYPVGHPFFGYDYIGLTNLIDKTHKLSATNSYVRDTKGSMRLPIIPEDPDSPGTIYHNFISTKLSPGQTRLLCYPATLSQMQYFMAAGFHTSMYSPSHPLGKNTVAAYFKEIGCLLQLTTPLTGHALRSLCITKLVNGGVAITEVMSTARHNSVSASSVYQRRTGESHKNKMAALGISVGKENKTL